MGRTFEMRCPKNRDTESSTNAAFSQPQIRRPKNLGHRIGRQMAEIAGALDLTTGPLDPEYADRGVPDTDKPERKRTLL